MTTRFLFAALVLVHAAAWAEEAAPQNPNIIVLLADDMGWADIGAFGSEVATPNLDRLAAEGLRFTQFHNTSKCYPSRAALMTGQYAQHVGMSGKKIEQFENAATLGDVLRSVGYRTIMVGKHHARENPYDIGFDHYYGLRDGATNHFNPGLQRPGEPVPAQKRPGSRTWCFDSKCLTPFTPDDKDFYSSDAYTDWSIDLLDRYRGEDKPFFLYLSFQAPHDPLHAWPDDIARYRDRYEAGYGAIADTRYQKQLDMGLIDAETYPQSNPIHRDWDALSEDEQADEVERMATYGAMIDNMDMNIGRLLAYLRETGEDENTLILFVSDNGASAEMVEVGDGPVGAIDRWASLGPDWANVSNTPFRYFKNMSFAGGINTPFIAHWPGRIKGDGRVTEHTGHLVDIMATLIDVTGAAYPSEMRGQTVTPLSGESLLPVFRGDETPRQETLFFQWQRGAAVIDGDWKLVRGTNREPALYPWSRTRKDAGGWELYNLAIDRTETIDLADNEPQVFKRMQALYVEWWADANPIAVE